MSYLLFFSLYSCMGNSTLGLRSILRNVSMWFMKMYMQLFKLLFYELSRTTLDYTRVITWQNNIMKLFVKFSDNHSFNKYLSSPTCQSLSQVQWWTKISKSDMLHTHFHKLSLHKVPMCPQLNLCMLKRINSDLTKVFFKWSQNIWLSF